MITKALLEKIKQFLLEEIDIQVKEEEVYKKTLATVKNNSEIKAADLPKIATEFANQAFSDENKEEIDEGDIELVVDMVVDRIKDLSSGSDEKAPDSEDEKTQNPKRADLDPEVKKELIDAYNNFKENFYEEPLLLEQAKLVKALLSILRKIHKKESEEKAAGLQRVSEEEEKIKPDKGDLKNLQADARSFFQTLIKSKKAVATLASAVEKGLQLTVVYKKKVLDTIEDVQEQASILHSDIVSLIEKPKKEPEKLDEDFVSDLVDKSARFQEAYEKVVETIDLIMPRLLDETGLEIEEFEKVISQALETLEGVIDIFPSVKTFTGEVEDIVQVQSDYIEAIRNLGLSVSNVQTLVKGRNLNFITLNNYAGNISEFSQELERIFGTASKIKTTTINQPEAEPSEEPEQGEQPEPPPGEEQPEETPGEEPTPEDQPEVTSYSVNPQQTEEIFSFWKNKYGRRGLSRSDFEDDISAFSNFIGPFIPDHILRERTAKGDPLNQISSHNILIGKKMEIKNKYDSLSDEKEKESIMRILNAFMPLNNKKLKALSKFLRSVSVETSSKEPESVSAPPDPEKEKLDKEKARSAEKAKQQAARDNLKRRKVKRAQRRQRPGRTRIGGVTEEQLYSKLETIIRDILREEHG